MKVEVKIASRQAGKTKQLMENIREFAERRTTKVERRPGYIKLVNERPDKKGRRIVIFVPESMERRKDDVHRQQ